MTARNDIFIILLVSLLPTFLVLGLNILVDPYNELGIRIVPRPLVETSRTEKISLLIQLKAAPELMIFGSSRAMELDPKRFPVRTFNMAVNSALPEDILAQVLWLEERDLLPEKALLMIDYYVFNGRYPTDSRLESARFLYRLVDSLPEVKELRRGGASNEIITPFWVKYFSRSMAKDSRKTIKVNSRNGERVVMFKPNGLLVRKRDLMQREKSGWSFEAKKKIPSYALEKYTGYEQVSPARVSVLEKTLDVLRRHNVEVVIALTSFHPALQQYVKEDDELAKRLDEVKKLLRRLAGENSGSFIDYSDIRSFNCSPAEMWDIIHLMPECADKLVDDVLASTPWLNSF
jgi:hypothetical protein